MSHNKETFERRYDQGRVPWDSGKPYQQLIDYVDQNNSSRALDVGCGTGTDAIYLAQNGFKVSAIDISKKAIKIAESEAQKKEVGVDFRVGNVLNMPFENETFEFVNDNGCFHSLQKSVWKKLVKEVSRIMKPRASYLMKCFSEHSSNPHRVSQEEIRQCFSENFDILDIKLIVFEGRHGRHEGYSCLMERK